MLAVGRGQTFGAIFCDGAEFVQLVLAQPFRAESARAKAEASGNDERERDDDECAAERPHALAGVGFGADVRRDGGGGSGSGQKFNRTPKRKIARPKSATARTLFTQKAKDYCERRGSVKNALTPECMNAARYRLRRYDTFSIATLETMK
jgi:hypothetical protein